MSSTTTLNDVANKIAAVVNRGAVSGTISSSGGTYTIPAGYHNGSGKVTGPTLATLVGTNVNCDSNARLLSGYTAYGKNGVKYTGSIASKGALNWSGSNTTYSVPAGYYTGGTLDSRPSYNAGVTAGTSAGRTVKTTTLSATASSSTQTTTVIFPHGTSYNKKTCPITFTLPSYNKLLAVRIMGDSYRHNYLYAPVVDSSYGFDISGNGSGTSGIRTQCILSGTSLTIHTYADNNSLQGKSVTASVAYL